MSYIVSDEQRCAEPNSARPSGGSRREARWRCRDACTGTQPALPAAPCQRASRRDDDVSK